jgi:hypothetical protein
VKLVPTANAQQDFSAPSLLVQEGVETEKTASMVDRDWQSANVPQLLACLSDELHAGGQRKVVAAESLHEDVSQIASRVVMVRLQVQSTSAVPSFEVYDIYEVFSDRTEIEFLLLAGYSSKSQAESAAAAQVGLEMTLLRKIATRAGLR